MLLLDAILKHNMWFAVLEIYMWRMQTKVQKDFCKQEPWSENVDHAFEFQDHIQESQEHKVWPGPL